MSNKSNIIEKNNLREIEEYKSSFVTKTNLSDYEKALVENDINNNNVVGKKGDIFTINKISVEEYEKNLKNGMIAESFKGLGFVAGAATLGYMGMKAIGTISKVPGTEKATNTIAEFLNKVSGGASEKIIRGVSGLTKISLGIGTGTLGAMAGEKLGEIGGIEVENAVREYNQPKDLKEHGLKVKEELENTKNTLNINNIFKDPYVDFIKIQSNITNKDGSDLLPDALNKAIANYEVAKIEYSSEIVKQIAKYDEYKARNDEDGAKKVEKIIEQSLSDFIKIKNDSLSLIESNISLADKQTKEYKGSLMKIDDYTKISEFSFLKNNLITPDKNSNSNSLNQMFEDNTLDKIKGSAFVLLQGYKDGYLGGTYSENNQLHNNIKKLSKEVFVLSENIKTPEDKNNLLTKYEELAKNVNNLALNNLNKLENKDARNFALNSLNIEEKGDFSYANLIDINGSQYKEAKNEISQELEKYKTTLPDNNSKDQVSSLDKSNPLNLF